MTQGIPRIAILLDNKQQRQQRTIEGLGLYLKQQPIKWQLLIGQSLKEQLGSLAQWPIDGIIADYDSTLLRPYLENTQHPCVVIGSSFDNPNSYPQLPYMAHDTGSVTLLAYQHLKQKGLESFACYSPGASEQEEWAHDRERHFSNHVRADGYRCDRYQGLGLRPLTWDQDLDNVCDWLSSLALPVGILAVNDLLAADIFCAAKKLALNIPEQIALIGVDDENISEHLYQTGLSSVPPGDSAAGYQAAKTLHQLLSNQTVPSGPQLINGEAVQARTSTDYQALEDPLVIQAMQYIRTNVHRGIKVDQVLSHLDVSRTNLQQRFMQQCGHSIHHYIHQSRLDQAKKMLCDTSLPVAEIAELCGYHSVHYLYSVFNKEVGTTPVNYRNKKTQ